jgi:hypothetical protein
MLGNMRELARNSSLLSEKTIKQAIAARAAKIGLAAAAVWSARGMRRIPRPRSRIVTQTLAVNMA